MENDIEASLGIAMVTTLLSSSLTFQIPFSFFGGFYINFLTMYL